MFTISQSTAYSKSTVATFPTFDAAREYAENNMAADFFEVDEDYEGCADFLSRGEVYAVEPVGFSAAA